jgi:uncharacterized protein (DUF3820 family)
MSELPKLTDTCILNYGEKHKDKKLIDVPAEYFLYIYNKNFKMPQNLKDYIEDNIDVLKKEMEENAKY